MSISALCSHIPLAEKHWHCFPDALTEKLWKRSLMVLILILWERLIRHMTAMRSTTKTKALLNLSKTTSLPYACYQRLATFVIEKNLFEQTEPNKWFLWLPASLFTLLVRCYFILNDGCWWKSCSFTPFGFFNCNTTFWDWSAKMRN